jgi:aminomethyltransferase
VSYAGATEEHRAVRECCGLFDVSHMGEIELRGPDAVATCQRLTVNDVARLGDGDGQYSVLCNEAGGVIDDLIVYRLDAARLLLVVNAANHAADRAWIAAHAGPGVDVVDRSDETALVALQGPEAEAVLRRCTPIELHAMPPFTVREGLVAGRRALVARTGYTGEDGFEVFADAADAEVVWTALLDAARRRGGQPAGLAARDTLRLEAGLPLHGSDMDATTTPLEAGLAWVVKLGKPDFIGRATLARQAEAGPARKLVGIEMDEPGIPRHGHPIWVGGGAVGTITSGTKSPTLGTFIAMGYVPSEAARPGTSLEVEIRGRRLRGHVVARPFYRRAPRERTHADT